jgi:hypothetical protein
MKEYYHFAKLLCAITALFFFYTPSGAQTVQIGSGTSVTNTCSPSPVGIYYKSTRIQMVYRKDELNAAGVYGGRIIQLGFDIVDTPNYDLPNYTIGMCHDTSNALTAHVAGPFQTVYQTSSYNPDTTGFDMLTLDSAFYWNGIDNIVVDVCWNRVPSYSCTGSVRYYQDTVIDYSRYTWSDGSDQCGQITGSTADKPIIQFVFQPLAANDASIIATNLNNIICAGNQPVKATVANYGTNVINSVMIGWRINGVLQTPYSLTSALDTIGGSGSSIQEVTLGNFNFVTGTNYAIEIFSYLPNNSTDPYTGNDTLVKNSTVGLQGTFTVGGVSPDFGTISSALAAIDSLGICDTVIISLRNGTYVEQLDLPNYSSSGSGNYVIIQGESLDSSLAIISYGSTSYSTNYVVRGIDIDKYTLRHLTIKSTGTTYSRVIQLDGSISNFTIQNCEVQGYAST